MSRAGSRADSINTSLGSSTEEDSDLPIAQLQDAVAAGTAQTANLAFGQLPDQDINDENIEDAYVQFILYCNPSLSPALPTIGLRRGFHAVPRADGKSFEVFELFKLMQKLQHGEIGSWNSLVVELGVDRPDPSKNQSSQKLGQYAVRLKRWLRNYHIDAFFKYCMGVPHEYYTKIPSKSQFENLPVRDGIPPEEDLALRCMLPDLRPKRGRRKEDDEENDSTPNKRQQRALSAAVEEIPQPSSETSTQSIPRNSSHPSFQPALAPPPQPLKNNYYHQSPLPGYNHNAYMDEAWAAASRAFIGPSPQLQVARTHASNGYWAGPPTPTTSWPYPQSAVNPQAPPNPFSISDGSQSAHPSTGRTFAVSNKEPERPTAASQAAQPPSPNGKPNRPRGRPPKNRAVHKGPWATFPSRQKSNDKEQPDGTASSPIFVADETAWPVPKTPSSAPAQRPSKLSLQVPQNPGGNVRLATPPPKVTLKGGDAGREQHMPTPSQQAAQLEDGRRSSADFFNSIDDEASVLGYDEVKEDDQGVNWKRRALVLQRKLEEARAELRAVKRRVMEAVM